MKDKKKDRRRKRYTNVAFKFTAANDSVNKFERLRWIAAAEEKKNNKEWRTLKNMPPSWRQKTYKKQISAAVSRNNRKEGIWHQILFLFIPRYHSTGSLFFNH
jgi:hypothetical protein